MGRNQKIVYIAVILIFGLAIAALFLDDYEVEGKSEVRSPLHEYLQPVKKLVNGDYFVSLGTLHKPLTKPKSKLSDTKIDSKSIKGSDTDNHTEFVIPVNDDQVKFKNTTSTNKTKLPNNFPTSITVLNPTHSPTKPKSEENPTSSNLLWYVNRIDKSVGAQPDFVRIGFDQEADARWVYFNIEGGYSCNEALETFKDVGIVYWEKTNGSKLNIDEQEQVRTYRAKAQLVGCFTPQGGTHMPAWNYFAAKMTGLDNKYSYAYQIGNLSQKKEEPSYQSETRVLEQYGDDPGSQHSYMMVGDYGALGRKSVMNLAKKDSFIAMIHVGDASYASNTGGCYKGKYGDIPECSFDCPAEDPKCGGRDRLNARNLNAWRGFHNILKPVTDRVPMMTTMGNHDNDFAWFLKYRPPLINASFPNVHPMYLPDWLKREMNSLLDLNKQETSMANLQAKANAVMKQPYFYSFDSGLVHFVSFGTEDNPINPYEMRGNANPYKSNYDKRFQEHFGRNSTQYKWLENDLKKINRTSTPWVVAYTHRPFYHSANHHSPCSRDGDWYGCAMRDLYTPLFEKYGVNLILAGHAHHYERSRPRINNTLASEGPIYVVLGTGGFKREGHFRTDSTKDSAFRISDYFGYVKMQVCNSTTLHWKFVAAVPGEKDGDKSTETAKAKAFDEVWIENWNKT
mmetsp:Transcript_5811/g.7638  ORF Transcript_5811/g.7638 Transcript_5811/m.7638 type:complete len:680 (+) Transcript_5811:446-2485(+)|eukprot:CAMPEP_0204863014 /NCGR_PEP_ID=MMETSP1348-20121228/2993_1 /ASSEMBLY_ACC=CAM_ASM_000700 /TAXON_ID=215587 /ORGANISM="Aplanochytrium stocchinoi, Strain GSBS06" /LENGTH=679 /DNA_ID=CAMNT_0052013219 /DNA_START=6 /DNA_END=2045 /DNA_ORIENTATION=+